MVGDAGCGAEGGQFGAEDVEDDVESMGAGDGEDGSTYGRAMFRY